MDRISAFKPIMDKSSRVLVLGSMPSVKSLEQQEYYANPRNQFWKIIFALFNCEVELTYEKKISFVKSKGIAIWDVIASCYREGSLDSDIKDEKANDFRWLFTEYPNIKNVVFNGAKAYETFRKEVKFSCYPELVFTKLTSTSPANTMSYEEKLMDWKIIRDYI